MIEFEVKDGKRYLKNTNVPVMELYYAVGSGNPTKLIATYYGISEEIVNEIYRIVSLEQIKLNF